MFLNIILMLINSPKRVLSRITSFLFIVINLSTLLIIVINIFKNLNLKKSIINKRLFYIFLLKKIKLSFLKKNKR